MTATVVLGPAGDAEVPLGQLPWWFRERHDPAPVPTAIDIFGGEIVPFPKPPRELAERYFRVVGWAEHDRGGHFPAVAEPKLLADRLREAFRPCRES